MFTAFAFIFYVLFGIYLSDYDSLDKSFVRVLFMSVGKVDLKDVTAVSPVVGTIFMLLFFITIIYGTSTIFIGIYSESLRKIIISSGYPGDSSGISWTSMDFVIWFCFCVGKLKKKMDNKA